MKNKKTNYGLIALSVAGLFVFVTVNTELKPKVTTINSNGQNLFDEVLAGNSRLSALVLKEFEDDSKVNTTYLSLFYGVQDLKPDIGELKFLAASALVGKHAEFRKSNFRNLIIQLAYLKESERSQIDPIYQKTLLGIIKRHFPDIITKIKSENPNSAVLSLINNNKGII